MRSNDYRYKLDQTLVTASSHITHRPLPVSLNSSVTASHKSSDGPKALALRDGKEAVSDSIAGQKQLRSLVNLRDQEREGEQG